MKFIPIFFLLLTTLANASEKLVSTKDCVKEGYSTMTDRSGIIVAVLDDVDSEVLTFGKATQNQIFEVGSITKTFTANLLAQAVVANTLKLSDPIPAVYQKPDATITYQNLTTHTSGIRARGFSNFNSGNPLAPYEGLTVPLFKNLYAETPLESAPGRIFNYSNLGVALLGLILSENAAISYIDLVRKNIFAPLQLGDSYFHVPESEMPRFLQGHVIINRAAPIDAPYWDLSENALNPAGGIRSSIKDMITYARANLIPDSTSLAESIKLSQTSLTQAEPALLVGMNWFIDAKSKVIWHNGATAGFNSVIALSKKRNQAIVALTNTASYLIDGKGNVEIDKSFQEVAISCLK